MSLENFCRKPVLKISPERNIAEACKIMEDNNVGCLIAENEGKLCGILTDRDIALKVAGRRKDPQHTRVKEIMSTDPIRISVHKDLHHLTSLMHAYHVRRIPVVDGFDTTLGIITMDDLISLLAEEMWDLGKAISEGLPRGTA